MRTMAVAGTESRLLEADGSPKTIAQVDAHFQAAMQDQIAVLTKAYLDGSSNNHPGLAFDEAGIPSREEAEDGAAAVGDAFPMDHRLIDSNGGPTNLREALQQGPVVVTYFRGNWCTLCMLALKHLSQCAPVFRARYGASLIAVSGQLPPHNRACEKGSRLCFPVLCDKGLALAQELRIVFSLTKQEARFYDHITLGGFDGVYGPGHDFQLPLPAIFVLEKGTGHIAYAFVDSDLTKRSRLLRIEAALENLTSSKQSVEACVPTIVD